jgi:hypothetical protein
LNEKVSVAEGFVGLPAEGLEASSPTELFPHPLSRITTKQDVSICLNPSFDRVFIAPAYAL